MSTTKPRSAPKILVVDDEPDAAELVEFNLTAAGRMPRVLRIAQVTMSFANPHVLTIHTC